MARIENICHFPMERLSPLILSCPAMAVVNSSVNFVFFSLRLGVLIYVSIVPWQSFKNTYLKEQVLEWAIHIWIQNHFNTNVWIDVNHELDNVSDSAVKDNSCSCQILLLVVRSYGLLITDSQSLCSKYIDTEQNIYIWCYFKVIM